MILRNKFTGPLIAVIGFIMIVVNSLDYLLAWNRISGGVSVIGLMLVVIGMFFSKKAKSPVK